MPPSIAVAQFGSDLALAQAQAIRFHAMSASILADRAGHYRVLEAGQKDGLDITA